mmetsp:Transcript_37419/g.51370  ORF Transcript_37419/g.51370 Transcript_37419/m.51370 type:complete len:202 (-) Transcript_37419:144-749(-)
MSNQQRRVQRLREQEAKLAKARALHEGYPVLVNGGLDSNTCLYCHEKFASKGKLFYHLNKMIPAERMIPNWHQDHFRAHATSATLTQVPLQCPARCCQGRSFSDAEELRLHLLEMGVPGLEALRSESAEAPATYEDELAVVEESVVDSHVRLGQCFRCSAPRDTLMAQCGHTVACSKCAPGLASCPVCSATVARCISVCWS